jgi:hypothetical protein
MEIVVVKKVNEMKDANVYYAFDGKFWRICESCGVPVEVDSRRTAVDIRHEQIGEVDVFCSEDCERQYLLFNYPRLQDACLAGEDVRWRELIIRQGIPAYMSTAQAILESFDLDTDEDDVNRAEDREFLTVNRGRDGETYMWYNDGINEACVNPRTGEWLDGDKIVELFC